MSLPTSRPSDQQKLLQMVVAAKTIIFDFNGTLADDDTALEHAYRTALSDLSLPALAANDYADLLGTSEPEIAAELIQRRGEDGALVQPLLERATAHYVDVNIAKPLVTEQSVRFIRRLARDGKNVAIVTGTVPGMITPVLKERGLSPYIDLLVTIENVSHSKPDPEGFMRAARHFETLPADVLVFEDSPGGVAAARAAGMPVIGVGTRSALDLAFPSMDTISEIVLSARSLVD